MKPAKTLLVLGISATLGGCMSVLTTAVPIIWEASKSEILMGSLEILAQVLLGTNKTTASTAEATTINQRIQELNGKASAPQSQPTAKTESKDLSQLLQLIDVLTQQVLKQPTLENKSAALAQYQPEIRTLLDKYQADIPKNANGLQALEGGLPVAVNYAYRQVGQNEMKNLTNGTVLRDGDHYKITFTPQADGYVYIFQTDSAGKVYQLFPMASMKGVEVHNYNPVKAKVTYTLPANDKSFYLDNQIGEEKIYFIATKQPDQALEQQMAANLKTTKFSARGLGGISNDKNAQQTKVEPSDLKLLDLIRSRAPAAVVSDTKETQTHKIKDDDGQVFNLTYQKLDGWCGQQKGCASVISFRHEARLK
ncbi:MAG: hypothetical protein RIT27_2035 [Pseudomonadota bacterium]|jgi:hypothetical protein